ncbi:hypothetical protein AAZX31_17G053200 [Glycine max]
MGMGMAARFPHWQVLLDHLEARELVLFPRHFDLALLLIQDLLRLNGTKDIEKATDNFHASRIPGEGVFGLVYSGILEDGMKVAFKVLKREDPHGDHEFLAEVEMLSRLHHRNLVKLIGI